jgi:hypothetical protein
LAELRNLDSAYERLFRRKLTPKLGEAAAIYDPTGTLIKKPPQAGFNGYFI